MDVCSEGERDPRMDWAASNKSHRNEVIQGFVCVSHIISYDAAPINGPL